MRILHVGWILALGLVALPVYAQTSQPAQAKPAEQKPAQKAKKVWTNEDLAELPANSPVSSATAAPAGGGPAEAEAAAPAGGAAPGKPGALPPEKDPKVYQEKLEALRKRLADVEAKIKETQGAMSGNENGSNAVNVTQPTPILRPEDQLATYEKERKELQQQIDDLERQARENSISPGDIRPQ